MRHEIVADPGKIQTLHPAKKQGARIEVNKYEAMKEALLRAIPRTERGVPSQDLPSLIQPFLDRSVFAPDESVTWYCLTVKLDLEARRVVERVDGTRIERIRRV